MMWGELLAYHADWKLQRDGCSGGGSLELLYVTGYADVMVLLLPAGKSFCLCCN